jgi:hypothetical protein
MSSLQRAASAAAPGPTCWRLSSAAHSASTDHHARPGAARLGPDLRQPVIPDHGHEPLTPRLRLLPRHIQRDQIPLRIVAAR